LASADCDNNIVGSDIVKKYRLCLSKRRLFSTTNSKIFLQRPLRDEYYDELVLTCREG
jgi:hypothetical protein